METSISEFIERMQTPSAKLGVRELRKREETWRALWSWLDEDIKYFILRVGSTVRVVRRDYKSSLGELGQPHFDLKEIEVAVYEKTYNYNDGKYYYETKVVKIPSSIIAWFEFVSEQELAEEVERYSVEPLEEEAVV